LAFWTKRATNGIEAKEQANLVYNPLVHEQAIRWSAQSNRSKALSFKTQVKAGTLRISVQDPAEAGQVVKNPAIASQNLASEGQTVHGAKEPMKSVVGSHSLVCPKIV
jgi:hypothetical protein